jgi:hypothetical protein
MKSGRRAGKQALSDARPLTTRPDASERRGKELILPPPADRSLSARACAELSTAKNAHATRPPNSIPRKTPSARRSGGRQAHVAIAELDPTELLQLAGVECIAEPGAEPNGAPAAKRASRK